MRLLILLDVILTRKSNKSGRLLDANRKRKARNRMVGIDATTITKNPQDESLGLGITFNLKTYMSKYKIS